MKTWPAMVVLALSSCVTGTDADNCNDFTCDGCCDSEGTCRRGTTPTHCGGSGAVCASCPSGRACDNGVCSRCGDGQCRSGEGETCSTCPQDCGACPFCGDGKCLGSETCSTCAKDCGACPCGNGVCAATETCSSCSADCGACKSNYAACTATAQCLTGSECADYNGGTANRCRRTCTATSQCSGVAGFSNAPYCDTTNKLCNLSCASATATCPYGAACQKFSNGTYGYCD